MIFSNNNFFYVNKNVINFSLFKENFPELNEEIILFGKVYYKIYGGCLKL